MMHFMPTSHAQFLIAFLSRIAGLIAFTLALSVTLDADPVSHGNILFETVSPDRRFGVTVPNSYDSSKYESNNLVDIQSGRVVGAIIAEPAFIHMNNGEVLPTWWSTDDGYLLWQVNGKWSVRTQMLICLRAGAIQWEEDVLAVLQRRILSQTEAQEPEKFLAAKKQNWGDGSAYPEKFTIESVVLNNQADPLAFPVHFRVFLTSDPKCISGLIRVDSRLEATVDRDGKVVVNRFYLGTDPPSPSWINEGQ